MTNTASYEYLAGDQNLLALSFNLQYRVKDPYTYHYRTQNPEQVITASIRQHLRAFISSHGLDRMLHVLRVDLEREISALLTSAATRLNPVLSGVELIRANLLAIHPVNETMNAFREISSSQEDRERIIVNGQRFLVNLIPQAHGNAAYEVEHARGEAFRKVTTSGAEAGAIRVVSKAVRGAPEVLQNKLWREKMETALSDNDKVIVPNRQSLEKVALWKRSMGEGGRPAPLRTGVPSR